MATIDIVFNDKTYSIEESAFEAAAAALRTHFLSAMSGSGATIDLGGTTYNIDSTKLSAATTNLVTHLGKISGSGSKVTVGGVEYSFAPSKVQDAIADLEVVLGGLQSGDGDSSKTVILPETMLEFTAIETGGYQWQSMDATTYADILALGEGDTVKIEWDGVEYTCTGVDYVYDGFSSILFGNLNLGGLGDDTGEPFILGINPTYGVVNFNTFDQSPSHTVAIYKLSGGNGDNGDEVLFAEQEVTDFKPNSTYGGYSETFNPAPFVLTIGETYRVVWDNVSYTCVAQDCSAINDGAVFIGNASRVGLSGNNEPFAIVYAGYGSIFLDFNSTATSHTVAVYKVAGGNEGDGESRVTILEETTIEVTGSSWQGKGEELYANILALNEGDAIEVVWDGTKYNCIGVVHVHNGINTVMFGNLGLFGEGENTGEPFLLSVVADYSIVNINTLDTVDTSHTVAIYKISSGNGGDGEVILEENELTFVVDGNSTNPNAAMNTMNEIVLGNTYKVLWDGTEYECVASSADGVVYIGNAAFAGGEDDGIPFVIMYGSPEMTGEDYGMFMIVSMYDTTEAIHTVAIYKVAGGNGGSDNSEYEVIMPLNDYNFADDGGMYGVNIDHRLLNLGDTYRVVWDGQEYDVSTSCFEDCIVAGNLSSLELGDDTGEPFIILAHTGEYGTMIYAFDTATSHNVGIYRIGVGTKGEVLLAENTYAFENHNPSLTPFYKVDLDFSLTEGEIYRVVWEEQEYVVFARLFTDGATVVAGNFNLLDDECGDTGEPFIIVPYESTARITTTETANSHYVGIYKNEIV